MEKAAPGPHAEDQRQGLLFEEDYLVRSLGDSDAGQTSPLPSSSQTPGMRAQQT